MKGTATGYTVSNTKDLFSVNSYQEFSDKVSLLRAELKDTNKTVCVGMTNRVHYKFKNKIDFLMFYDYDFMKDLTSWWMSKRGSFRKIAVTNKIQLHFNRTTFGVHVFSLTPMDLETVDSIQKELRALDDNPEYPLLSEAINEGTRDFLMLRVTRKGDQLQPSFFITLKGVPTCNYTVSNSHRHEFERMGLEGVNGCKEEMTDIERTAYVTTVKGG